MIQPSKKHITALTIAGSDSSGGAGIQADLKTFSSIGVYGMSVVTALTAQNTREVKSIYDISVQFVGEQLDSIFEDMEVNAVKIGMLHCAALIEVVAEKLKLYGAKNIVLDPVMIAKSGDLLLKTDAIECLRNTLLPLTSIVTPNLPETSLLLDRSIHLQIDMEMAGIDLMSLGSKAALIKGGHLNESEQSPDFFIEKRNGKIESAWLIENRIQTKNTHGTGCTLSSAIAAYLALGFSLKESVIQAKRYLTLAIRSGARFQLGSGHGPVDHFFERRLDESNHL